MGYRIPVAILGEGKGAQNMCAIEDVLHLDIVKGTKGIALRYFVIRYKIVLEQDEQRFSDLAN